MRINRFTAVLALACSAFVTSSAACSTKFDCCLDGRSAECDCPANAECDAPQFDDCGDGTCVIDGTCSGRPETSAEGIGGECPPGGCADGQECITANELSTCEIRCAADDECPEDHHCNLPPIVPDSLPEVCVVD